MGVQVLAGWPWRPSSKAGLLLSRATAYRLWLRACCEGPEAIGGGTAEKQAGLGRRILPSDPTIHGIDQARFGGTEISAIIHRHAPQKQNTIRAVHATHHQRKCSIEARLSLHGYTAYWRETLIWSSKARSRITPRRQKNSARARLLTASPLFRLLCTWRRSDSVRRYFKVKRVCSKLPTCARPNATLFWRGYAASLRITVVADVVPCRIDAAIWRTPSQWSRSGFGFRLPLINVLAGP